MNYVVFANPNVTLDLMVDEEFYPQLVSYCQRMGCKYAKERTAKPFKGRKYRVLKDITGPNGSAVGELLGLFYSLEWGTIVEGGTQRKFYILINQRRKGKKKNAGKNRKEVGKGSDGGDSGESSCDPGSGPVDGYSGDGVDAGSDGADDLWESPRVE